MILKKKLCVPLQKSYFLLRAILYIVLLLGVSFATEIVADAAPSVLPKSVIVNNAPLTYCGYTVFSVQGKDKVFVIDMAGITVHSWHIPGVSAQFKPLPNGHILVIVSKIPNYRIALREYDWDGNLVWEFPLPPKFQSFNHDVARLQNGNTLTIASVEKTIPEFIPRPVKDSVIVEVNKAGEIVWEWSALEHYEELGLSQEAKEYLNSHPEIVDVFHTNSVQALPPNNFENTDSRFKAGNILISQRHTSRLLIVDRASGSVVWSAANTIAQHHASMIPPSLQGGGNILVFDNGGSAGYPPKSRPYSIVEEINPLTTEVVWNYQALDNDRAPDTFFSLIRSSAERLPNGNTLIVESTFGRIFEVTNLKKIVWEYVSPYYRRDYNEYRTNQIYRAYRVDYTWPIGKVGPGEELFVW
jgi:hypothetical protein